ncbi:MAG: YicC/YloC family endoribonuclease [Alistipes shahii]
MTGFGKGEATLQNKKITVEIRSLNSKQLDLGLRLPAVYRQSEYEIRNIITRTVQRGKVDVFVTVESQTVETPARINKEVFAAYAEQLRDAARNAQLNYAGIGWRLALPVQAIMRLPEVVSTEAESISDEEHAALVAATEAAVAQLDAFRLQEGAILIADLLSRVDKIEGYKQEVVPFEKARTETVRARLLENLEKLQVDVDRNRLEQEMIFYLEKLDITEEKVRLANHCRYFREVAAQEEGAGRKLGFIAQEMGREINTMGSKANESNIQILVVKMKDELEKIKEQVLNIL